MRQLSIVRAFVLSLSLALGVPDSSAQWTPPEEVLSYVRPEVFDISLAVRGEQAILAFGVERPDDTGFLVPSAVLVTRREEAGWSAPVTVSSDTRLASMPRIALDRGGTAHLAWRDLENISTPRALLYKRDPFGLGPVEVAASYSTQDEGGAELFPSPFYVLADRDAVRLVYETSNASGPYLTHVARTVKGWGAPSVHFPSLESDVGVGPAGTLLAATRTSTNALGQQGPRRFLVALASSPDQGATWTSPMSVAATPAGAQDFSPRVVATPDGRIHVLWRYSPDGGLATPAFRHSFSDDGGASWSAPDTIRAPDEGFVRRFEVVAGEDGRVHMFMYWLPQFFGDFGRLYHAALVDGRWSAFERVSSSDGVLESQRNPALSVDDGRVYVVWKEADGARGRVLFTSARLADLGPPRAVLPENSGLIARPNPAKDTTDLLVNLSEGGDVSVRVVDARGRVVVLQPVGYRAAGAQSVRIVTSSLASGVYLAEICVGDAAQTGTFTVVH